MKDKNLPLDYDNRTLEELTDEANKMIKSLEEKDDLDNSVDRNMKIRFGTTNSITFDSNAPANSLFVTSNGDANNIKSRIGIFNRFTWGCSVVFVL